MVNEVKTTIIIITENNKTTIMRTLNSIVENSKHPNLIIIGDNDSNDQTYDFLCENLGANKIENSGQMVWPPKYETIYRKIPVIIFRKRQGSMGQALNICINLSHHTTDVYGFLNSSDWYEPNTIENVLKIFDTHKYCSCIVGNSIDHFPEDRIEYNIKRSYDGTTIYNKYEYGKNIFIPLSFLRNTKNGFNEQLKFFYDYEMILRLSKIGLIYHTAEFLCNHRVNDELTERSDELEQEMKLINISVLGIK